MQCYSLLAKTRDGSNYVAEVGEQTIKVVKNGTVLATSYEKSKEWIEGKNMAKRDTYGQKNICQIPGCSGNIGNTLADIQTLYRR